MYTPLQQAGLSFEAVSLTDKKIKVQKCTQHEIREVQGGMKYHNQELEIVRDVKLLNSNEQQ